MDMRTETPSSENIFWADKSALYFESHEDLKEPCRVSRRECHVALRVSENWVLRRRGWQGMALGQTRGWADRAKHIAVIWGESLGPRPPALRGW